MFVPFLATKLYVPPPRPNTILRPRLVARLNEGLAEGRKLALVSAAAGFGKTTLLSEWIADLGRSNGGRERTARPPTSYQPSEINTLKFCWLSLDASDSEPTRFLVYLIAALQTAVPSLGEGVSAALQTPQPPASEVLLAALLNEITALPGRVVLVLDDYHALDSPAVDAALTFLLDHLPPQLHLVIASREDPPLPLARLRAGGQLTELRAADLRFTPAEAAEFLNQGMGLTLSQDDIAALEARTEGWIAGLQLAALAMQAPLALQAPLSIASQPEAGRFIQSFSGSHRFVLDYLLEEVLHKQSDAIQTFLLRTSILERLCASLCDAIIGDGEKEIENSIAHPIHSPGPSNSRSILEQLERANLFLVPLDDERRWYRYHHLFRDLLRQRLSQTSRPDDIARSHILASEWYENNGLMLEAFHHATAANDVVRAERLVESKQMGLHLRSVAMAVLNWLDSLPTSALNARPLLLVRYATLSLMAGQTTGVEEKLQAAESAFQGVEPDEKVRDLFGQMACARATLALTHYDPPTMIAQARRALEYLHPKNLTFRFTANWALASASLLQGDRATAAQACRDGITISEKSGDTFSRILATSDLGLIQELENQLHQAAQTYRQVLQLAGDHPQPNASEAYLGLAHIYYEWNDLEAAERFGQQSLQLARQYDRVIDRFIISEVFLARLKLAQGDAEGAGAMLAQTEQTARQKSFVLRLPEIAAAQVLVLLGKGDTATAEQLVQQFDLPLSRARLLLAQDDPSAALAILGPFCQEMAEKAWQDERLRAMVLQAVALYTAGEKGRALDVLAETLTLAEPGGFVRLFIDEGETMRLLISDFRFSIDKPSPRLLAYADKLLAAFPPQSAIRNPQSDILTSREIEILHLIAEGLTNEQIANRLYLSLYTVKAHVRNIFGKLEVANRTQAVARARELGLL